MATVTFNSNLTHTDTVGSTVTSATTTDVITTPTTLTTSAHILAVQSIDPAASGTFETVVLGDVAVTGEHCVRLRNLGFAVPANGGNSVPFIEIALQTGASAYSVLGRLYATETWGPARMQPQTSSGSPYPRLVARSASTTNTSTTTGNSAMNLEVIAGDLGTPTA